METISRKQLALALRYYAAHRAQTLLEARGALQCAQLIDEGIDPDRITHPTLARVVDGFIRQGFAIA